MSDVATLTNDTDRRVGLRSIPVRVYMPHSESEGALLLFVHGGGFSWGALDDFDQICRNLVLATGGTVASVGYRLAPQHPFPAGLDDVVEAARWAAAEIGDLAGPEALFIPAGDSAGGCLAAGAAQRLRDEGGPALDGQILIYPMIEYHDRTPASFHDLARRLVGSVPCRPCVEQTTCGTIWPAVDGVRRS